MNKIIEEKNKLWGFKYLKQVGEVDVRLDSTTNTHIYIYINKVKSKILSVKNFQ